MKLRRFLSCMMALLLVCSLPVTAFADTWYLDEGSITVNATESGQTVSQNGATTNDDAPVITQHEGTPSTDHTVTITATENATANVTIQDVNIVISDPEGSPENHSDKAAVTIDVADGATANVTLDGVKIDTQNTGGESQDSFGMPVYISGEAAVQIKGSGDVTLELDGKNTVQSGPVRAGVEKNNSGNLTITDENGTDGSLKATGGDFGSGIGGGRGKSGSKITIEGSAEVNAQGGDNGAGIGGGVGGSGSNIIIKGSAEVTANGGNGGSGIGGGFVGGGSKITITGSAEVTATGGINASGIGGGGGSGSSDITISGSAEVTANGGNGGSGIGGGSQGTGRNITISGSAEVTAKGGASGAGIGGGRQSTGSSDIAVSGDAQVKAQGGEATVNVGAGAAIGEGGKWEDTTVVEVKPDTDALNEGWIATYAPSTTMDTDAPNSVSYMDNGQLTTSSNAVPILKKEPTCTADGNRAGFTIGNTQVGGEMLPATGHSFTNYVSDNNATYDHDGTKTAKCDHCDATHTIPDPGSKLVREEAPQPAQPLYRVTGQDGKALACKTEQSSGVLTITVDADFATLTGKLSNIQTLKAQGVDTIVFVTKGAASTFALSDLLAQGSSGDTYQLTHDGETVTFTLGTGADISKILK